MNYHAKLLRRRISLVPTIAALVALFALVTSSIAWSADYDHTPAVVDQRLSDAIRFFASDEMEGRGAGTEGLNKAADYVAAQYKAMGLKTDLFEGSPFQKLKIPGSAGVGAKEKNRVVFVGPADEKGQPRRIALTVETDYTPLAAGASAAMDLPLVFVGYGISAQREGYDDYAGLDVKGKCVIIMRHFPQQANAQGLFAMSSTQYAPIQTKISTAYQHGAAAVILCTSEHEIKKNLAVQQKQWQATIDGLAKDDAAFKQIEQPTREQVETQRKKVADWAAKIADQSSKMAALQDPLLSIDGGGDSPGMRSVPIVNIKRAALDAMLKAALSADLSALEKQIDEGKPHSAELMGWRVQGETQIVRKETEIKNVIGVLEGEGPLADETIVVGAHYDHLGMGGRGSLAPGVTAIHNGADDNGSGTITMLEVARQLAARDKKLHRRIMFMAFSGEERGLLGSAYYVKQPLYPLDKTIAMLNLDMVGRLKDNMLIVYGTGTSDVLNKMIDRYVADPRFKFNLHKETPGAGPSDHQSFYNKQVPVLHFFTGTHEDYHRPTDKADKINIDGMRRVSEMVAEMAVELAETTARPPYQVARGRSNTNPRVGGPNDLVAVRPYFGSIPDYASEGPGLALTGVTSGGPADLAGLKAGDVIVQFGDSKIGNIEDFDSALRKHTPGETVTVVVKRSDSEVKLDVTLGLPPS